MFTREELRDNDGVELAVESLNEGHNLRTPGMDKLEERRNKKGKKSQRCQKHLPINFSHYLNTALKLTVVYMHSYMVGTMVFGA